MGNINNKLEPKTIVELSQQTGLESQAVTAWYKDFTKGCPSGKLKRNEFEDIYKQFFPKGDATLFSREVFRTFDKDENGTIDFSEFLIGMSVVNSGSVDQKLKWAFDMYDLDKSGSITRSEMLYIVKAIYKMRGEKLSSKGQTAAERSEYLFDKLDTNKDNAITEEEFLEAAKSDPKLVSLLSGVK